MSLDSLLGNESRGLSLRLRGCSSTDEGCDSVGSAGLSSVAGSVDWGTGGSWVEGAGESRPGEGFSGATGEELPLGAPLLPPDLL